MSDPASNRFQLGDWQVHASENCIIRGEERVSLEPRVMDLLVFLSRHPEQTLGKDEILQSVWGSLHHSDSVIARAISLLRQHLHDDARNPAYIRTIPSRGYRLIAPVTPLVDGRPTAPIERSEGGAARVVGPAGRLLAEGTTELVVFVGNEAISLDEARVRLRDGDPRLHRVPLRYAP